jgi:uncharacterized phage infection (PIP) family protein YhgE
LTKNKTKKKLVTLAAIAIFVCPILLIFAPNTAFIDKIYNNSQVVRWNS